MKESRGHPTEEANPAEVERLTGGGQSFKETGDVLDIQLDADGLEVLLEDLRLGRVDGVVRRVEDSLAATSPTSRPAR